MTIGISISHHLGLDYYYLLLVYSLNLVPSRHISTDSAISYSGYLLKRSNQPSQEAVSSTDVVEVDPFDIPELPRMPGMFASAMDQWSDAALATPSEDFPVQLTELAMPSPAMQVPLQLSSTPPPEPVAKTSVQQGLDAVAAFFGISIEPDTTQQNETVSSTQPLHIHNQNNNLCDHVIRQPPKSTPIKVGGNHSLGNRDSFQAASYHRRSSAPVDTNNPEEMDNPLSPNIIHPPPKDFVDSKGHLWRAKYCVLENGILYFYRNTTDGESAEAINERREARKEASGTSGKPPAFSSKDLSKSPMPRARHLESSLSDDSSGCMWEKKVHLDCVGAVRSAEQEYGPNSFELIGIDTSEETNEALVLRAKDSTDMKEWIFQFHRSLASFLRNIMGAYLDLDYFPPVASRTSILLSSSPSEKQLHELMQQHQESPQLAKSLSHGHGRITVHRRRQDVPFASPTLDDSNGSVSAPQSPRRRQDDMVSPSSDSNGSPQQFQFHVKERSPSGSPCIQSPTASPTERFLIPPQQQKLDSSQELHEPQRAPELAAPESAYPETERPKPIVSTAKYIPTHLPNEQAATSAPKAKYVPPHLRKKHPSDSEKPKSRHIPLHPRGTGIISLEDRAKNASEGKGGGEDYLPRPQPFDEKYGNLDIVKESTTPFKCGGCADPDVMEGSILDASFIPRKASRLGKVSTEAFGCYGGGNPHGDEDAEDVLNWETGAASECGIRDSNEDAYLIASDLLEAFKSLPQWHNNSKLPWTSENASHNLGLFALFDGHCGNEAARFAAEKLASFLYEETMVVPSESSRQDNTRAHSPLDPGNVENVLREAIIKLDDEFCRVCHEGGREWESGATALVGLLVNEHLIIANLGDCRGVLCRSVEDKATYLETGCWKQLDTVVDDTGRRSNDLHTVESRHCFWKEVTDIHNPSARVERERIEKANGWVTTETEIPIGQLRRIDFQDGDVIGILKRCFNDDSRDSENKGKERRSAPQRILEISRVCGELAVSRALGDRDFKAAFNSSSQTLGEDTWWDCPLFLPCPDAQPRRFQGDLVSNMPSFQSIRVGEPGIMDEFLLFGCDGLWDVLDVDDAVRVTRDLLYRKQWTAKKAVSISFHHLLHPKPEFLYCLLSSFSRLLDLQNWRFIWGLQTMSL
jgi:serine/threonine protein phosphatase PrpC